MSLVTVHIHVDAGEMKLATLDDLKKVETGLLKELRAVRKAVVTDPAALAELEKGLEASTEQLKAAVAKNQ